MSEINPFMPKSLSVLMFPDSNGNPSLGRLLISNGRAVGSRSGVKVRERGMPTKAISSVSV